MISAPSPTVPLATGKSLRGPHQYFSYLDDFDHIYQSYDRKLDFTYKVVKHNHRFPGLHHQVRVVAPHETAEEMEQWCAGTLGRPNDRWARTHTGFFFHTRAQATMFIMAFKGKDG